MTSLSKDCERSGDAAAYLDGELDAYALPQFEEHLVECRGCAEELKQQRQLLSALDFALGPGDESVALPSDFARIIAASAESDMSGVRNQIEYRRALRFSLILLLASFLLLGGASIYNSVLVPIKAVSGYAASVVGFAWYAFYNAGVGALVILRPIGRHLLFELHPISLVSFLLFSIAVAILPRLIVRYHRASITE